MKLIRALAFSFIFETTATATRERHAIGTQSAIGDLRRAKLSALVTLISLGRRSG
jgi:hypothetical protein